MSKAIYLLRIEGESPVSFTTQRAVALYLDGYIKEAMKADEQWERGICMGGSSGPVATQHEWDTGAAGGPYSLWGHLWATYAKEGCLNAYFMAKTEHYGDRQCSPHGGMYSEMMWTKPGTPFSIEVIFLLTRNDAQWFRDHGTSSDLT